MKKYCVMPFASVRFENTTYDNPRDFGMGFRPCCQYRPQEHITFSTLDEYLNSNFLKNLQNHMLTQDELPEECRLCKKDEDENGRSVRSLKNKFFNNQVFTETNILELDIFPSNTCNLQCIMCSPKHSSAVGSEQKKFKIIDNNYNFDKTDTAIELIDQLQGVEYISVAGGEMFYFKNCKDILSKIVEKNIPNFKITTNGTVFNPQHIELLQKIKNLTIRFSLDGTGDRYNFIRYPAKWSEVADNITKFKQALPNAQFETVIVMLPFSMLSFLDWIDFANELGLETHYLPTYSPVMSWQILTKSETQVVIDRLMSEIKNHSLTQSQKVNLLAFLKVYLPKQNYNLDIRKQAVHSLALKSVNRNYSRELIQTVTEPWPNLQKELLDEISRIEIS